ncbi:DUF397 domain-containing protein [Streptomyces pimonensis]|uniref:DUF397 domain-containing protein n=1 Tax=Streptomyces pimonensis TaxID=2860288 RepID=A0ABV4J0Y5_9ACTN
MREFDLSSARRRKSTYSGDGGEDCVEAAAGLPGVVPVRDSKVDGGSVTGRRVGGPGGVHPHRRVRVKAGAHRNAVRPTGR